MQFEFRVTGAKIGSPSASIDHLHVSFDGGPELGLYQESFTTQVDPGCHTLTVDVADAAHESLGIHAQTTFTVTAAVG